MLARRLLTRWCADATAGVLQELRRLRPAVASPADERRIRDRKRHRMTGRIAMWETQTVRPVSSVLNRRYRYERSQAIV
jgi:hypothetical protein